MSIEPGTVSVDVGGVQSVAEGMGLVGSFLGLIFVLIVVLVVFLRVLEKKVRHNIHRKQLRVELNSMKTDGILVTSE